MRHAIWYRLTARLQEGRVLPLWARLLRAILFPLETLFWAWRGSIGYQWHRDTWLIEGVEFSARALHYLSRGKGELYRVTSVGDTVTLERVRGDSV